MSRTRNEARWKIPFTHHDDLNGFLSEPRIEGIHSLKVGKQALDLYIRNQGHKATLVVFSGRLSLDARYVPQFSGFSVAEDTGVNLVSVSDPSMGVGDITVAWYMGNKETGPLRPILSPAIQHILDSLNTDRTILFGGSGGGFAAANYAHDFPNSLAFIFNPRLTLTRHAKSPLSVYLRECHNLRSDGNVGARERRTLESFGPIEAFELALGGLNHDLLIYQNLLDPDFLGSQVTPFIESIGSDPRLKLQFGVDNIGHTAIPNHVVRKIVTELAETSTKSEGIASAGFFDTSTAVKGAFRSIPDIAVRLRNESLDSGRKDREIAQTQKIAEKTHQQLLELQHHNDAEKKRMRQDISQLESQVSFLQKRVGEYEKIARYVPHRVRSLLKVMLRTG